jgi:hypothetical protein
MTMVMVMMMMMMMRVMMNMMKGNLITLMVKSFTFLAKVHRLIHLFQPQLI